MKKITFEHDGSEYSLRFDVNAIVRYEDATGDTFDGFLTTLNESKMSVSKMNSLFWAGITPKMTKEEAGNLMTGVGIGKSVSLVLKGVADALDAFNHDFDDALDTQGNPPARGKMKRPSEAA